MSLVSLETAKEYLKITVDDDSQDALIQATINAAENIVEKYIGASFISVSKVEIVDGGRLYFNPTVQPVVTVESIYSLDQEYTYTADEYTLVDGHIHMADNSVIVGSRWPYGRYQISYTAGYSYSGSVNNVPNGLNLVILILLARMWDNRGNLSSIGGAGGSQNWASIAAGSDIYFLLQPFILSPVVGD